MQSNNGWSIIVYPNKKSYIAKLEDLLKALLRNGLKISPNKCQLFRKELQYMENIIVTKDKRVCVKLLQSRLEAIQKLKSPMKVKGCRSFVGMVNSLSLHCPELQKWLKLIYALTRKGRQFIWGEEQQLAFNEIKSRLIKPPVLHLLNNKGRFHLYSDTSKFVMGSAL